MTSTAVVAPASGVEVEPLVRYDLTRLRRKGLIQLLPHTNTDVLTSEGVRFALFYTKVHDRLLIPLLAANTPPASPQLRQALADLGLGEAGKEKLQTVAKAAS